MRLKKELESTLQSAHPVLNEASLDLLRAGGKRIRPILVLLSARFGDRGRPEVKKAAVTLELIHMASLVHDDVTDDAELRRGKATVKAKWDNRVAMFTGDYIFAKAIELISEFDNPNAHLLISRTIRDLSLGEIEQIKDLYNWKQNLRRYLLRIKRKTAILMALSCQLGALAAGCDDQLARKLYYYGYFLGMSYQITDDILDFVGTEKQLGKPAGSDLRQGNITLPTLFALKNPELRGALIGVLEAEQPDEKAWRAAVSAVRTSGGIEQSEALSDRYLQKAKRILDDLPEPKTTRPLAMIADYIGRRKY
ncbi:heptaprenyl diphosphate synthase component II [Terrilactibacillus sp. S3-3]|nr:heptaprenyl diphosphate synthase component II [Terrilactibacillus sp. S3-3]